MDGKPLRAGDTSKRPERTHRRLYCPPEVRRLGTVHELTLSGGSSTIADNVTGTTFKQGT